MLSFSNTYIISLDIFAGQLAVNLFFVSPFIGFNAIQDSKYTSDVNWGCMLRSSQMLVAQVDKFILDLFCEVYGFQSIAVFNLGSSVFYFYLFICTDFTLVMRVSKKVTFY